jgi:hypothetical protein
LSGSGAAPVNTVNMGVMVPQAIRGECRILKGHGFSRAD